MEKCATRPTPHTPGFACMHIVSLTARHCLWRYPNSRVHAISWSARLQTIAGSATGTCETTVDTSEDGGPATSALLGHSMRVAYSPTDDLAFNDYVSY